MNLAAYIQLAPPKSRWKRDARRLMQGIVREYLAVDGKLVIDDDKLIARVDAAYPFGARERHPYSCWLEERKRLIGVLRPQPELPAPTHDEYGACEVATDILALADDLEGIGKAAEAKMKRDEALDLLIKQAPNRMNRACPVCGAKVGDVCVDPSERTGFNHWTRKPRLVPHLSRVEKVRTLFDLPLFAANAGRVL